LYLSLCASASAVGRQAPQTIFLNRGDSYLIKDIEHGYHSDKGTYGSRGSREQYSKLGVKTNIGHGHGTGISAGCYQSGTMSFLSLPYNRGAPSTWMNTHIMLYANGKRSLVNIIGGEFHLRNKKPKPAPVLTVDWSGSAKDGPDAQAA
jgi:hypothetical protein